MRRVLSGIRYDTSIATIVGAHTYGDFPRESTSWRATLYKAPRAYRFFLCGSGGQMTRFADDFVRGDNIGEEKIIPLEPIEAYAWAKEFLDDDAVNEFFFTFVKNRR